MAVANPQRDFQVIEKEDAKEAMEYVQKHGVSNLSTYLQHKIEQWKEVAINIGIVGEAGVGKSSFINTVRNLNGDDEGAAPVGVVETTTEPTPYPHPFNSKVIFWDLPGVGTLRYPKEYYLEAIGVERYDFFVILSDRRFTSHDGWLAEMLLQRKKPFFFVRTKFDEAIEDKSEIDPEVIRHKIVTDAHRSLKALKLKNCQIYVISNFEPDSFEFPILMDSIFMTLPDLKSQAMVFTLGTFCHSVIKEKKTFLKSRIWKVATLSAAGGAIPIPGLDIGVDITLLVFETKFYLEQFGLDDDSMTHLAERTGTTVDYYKDAIIKSRSILLARGGITSTIKGIILKQALKDCPRKFLKWIPFIGSVVNAATSFGTTYYFLDKLIEDLSTDAHSVLDRVTQRQVGNATRID
ncbi:interferon-inducible GTPase 5-like [Liolophura sinensis]|uniref:interferon-inducible GTPase 5-like n=1 Tax=Liolophura sinensis TaxID=3198878 RepID=UPI003158DB77